MILNNPKNNETQDRYPYVTYLRYHICKIDMKMFVHCLRNITFLHVLKLLLYLLYLKNHQKYVQYI